MPRNPGTGVYTKPAPDVVAGTTVESKVYNDFVNDVELDLNTKRPIVAGGTGADDAAEARDNLDAERSLQQVTNYDSHVWEAGSFYSTPGATGAPNGSDIFFGISYLGADNGFIEARSQTTGKLYIRKRTTAVWGAWVEQPFDPNADYVNVIGDTMTGGLVISMANPTLILNKTASGQVGSILTQTAGNTRWGFQFSDGTAEAGSDSGSNFVIYRVNDTVTVTTPAMTINRATGNATFNNNLTVVGNATVTGFLTVNTSNSQFNFDAAFANGIAIKSASMANAGVPLFFKNGSDATIGTVSITAGATGVAYNTTSDERLKEDLKSFDAGNIIDGTNVYDFKWKSTEERAYGVIAQQASTVYPAAITYNKEMDFWGVDYSKYIPVILQELKTLRARVAELEGRLSAGATPA